MTTYQKREEREAIVRAAAKKALLPCVRTLDGGNVLAVQAMVDDEDGKRQNLTITGVTKNMFSSKRQRKFSRASGILSGSGASRLEVYTGDKAVPTIPPHTLDALNKFARAFPGGVWDSGWRKHLKSIDITEYEVETDN